MRRFSQNLRFMNVSENLLNTCKHQRTSFLTSLFRSQNLTFQLLQARVTHFLQLCTFAFDCPNKQDTKSTEHVWSKVSKKKSKATTCLREFWETVGTKVWFRCSPPGSGRNGVNCRQKGRKLPPKRRTSKRCFFQSFKRVSYVKDLCPRQSLYAQCRGCTRSRLSKKSDPKNNFCERLESCMLKAGSIWTPFDAAIALSRESCWKSRIRVWSPLIGPCGGWGWGDMENIETVFFW